MKKFLGALVLSTFLATFALTQSQPLVISGGTLVNPVGNPTANSMIVIRDGKIAEISVVGRLRVPEGARVINAKGKWIIPGMIDSHVHFFQSAGLYTRPDVVDLRTIRSYEKEIEMIKANLDRTFARYLRAGVTSVVDVGGPLWNFDVRDLAKRNPKAPRVAVAGPLVSTFGPPAFASLADPPIIKANTPEEARDLVQKQAAYKPDMIKIWFIVLPGQTAAGLRPIIAATMDESRKHNLRVAVHATELETARIAVEEGASILVHSVEDKEVDDAFIALLKERRVLYTPTLVVRNGYMRTFSQQFDLDERDHLFGDPYIISTLFDIKPLGNAVPQGIRNLLNTKPPISLSPTAMKNLKRMQEAGVDVVVGTDAGNIGTLHASSMFDEIDAMAEAGLTPRQVLAAATINGARVMGREKELGSIEAGKFADMVILSADPLMSVGSLSQIETVIKNGELFTPADLIPTTPEDIVQKQVNAYNQRDLDLFADTYSPTIRIYTQGGDLIMSGREQLRAQYGRMFADSPGLHCTILKRIKIGDFVIDHERVIGHPKGTIEAVAIYEVKNSLIERVWFAR